LTTSHPDLAKNARPDLAAHRLAMRSTPKEVVQRLVDILGAKLVAYIGGVGETRAVRQWIEEAREPRNPETLLRLREALTIAQMICEKDGISTTQAWFMGLNPQLEDRSPAKLLRDGDPPTIAEVRGAARAFLVGG
jgi:hypothetical protein